MNHINFKFQDKIGGSMHIMATDGRREQLEKMLKKDTAYFKKHGWKKETALCSTYGDAGINEQAQWYVNHLQATSCKKLVFFPLKSSPQCAAFKFRYEVLKLLAPMPYHNTTLAGQLVFAQTWACTKLGYVIYQVDASQYEPKLYKPEIQAQPMQLELAA